MLQKIFSKIKTKGTSKSQDELPDSDFPPEFIDFITNVKSKTQRNSKKEPLKVPEKSINYFFL